MNGEDQQEWVDRFEHELELQSHNVNDLIKSVAKIGAIVETLAQQQKAIFGRQNRPVPWGAVVGGITLLAIMAGLLIAPMQGESARQHLFDITTMKHMIDDSYQQGVHDTELSWLKKMEDRLNQRLHRNLPKK